GLRIRRLASRMRLRPLKVRRTATGGTHMQITHFGHSCLLVHVGSAHLLIDPGAFSDGFADLDDLDASLITRRDVDHSVPDTVTAVREANPEATLVVEPTTAELVPDSISSARVRVVRSGDAFEIGEVRITVVGGKHAEMHPEIERIPNVGFYFDDYGLLHPG